MVEGPGIFHCKDGKIIQGVWEHNHLVGWSEFIFYNKPNILKFIEKNKYSESDF